MTIVLTPEDLNFLQHYGVKGMKWGVRRDQSTLDRLAGGRNLRKTEAKQGTRSERKATRKQQKADWKDYKKSTTRKERRADAKVAREEKVKYLLDAALKNPSIAIVVSRPGEIPTLAAGKHFTDAMMAGGVVDVNATNLTNMEFDLKDE